MQQPQRVYDLILQLKKIQEEFYKTFGVNDIISNSKIFEVLIANSLNHELIPGHSGSRDAKNHLGEFEYKHYKETSSNHTWTFNDFTDITIAKLFNIKAVIFAHIEDKDLHLPVFDWYYYVPGKVIGQYLQDTTGRIKNHRKMVNVSPKQIQDIMHIQKTEIPLKKEGKYSIWIAKIFDIAVGIQKLVGTTGILTSNKFWEVIVALILGHTVLSEQAGHDAQDSDGNLYEYKVSKTYSWNFQDISKVVLKKYLKDKEIILAKVNKEQISVDTIYSADAKKVVRVLTKKLKGKTDKWRLEGKELRRLQVSLSLSDLKKCHAKLIYSVKKDVVSA